MTDEFYRRYLDENLDRMLEDVKKGKGRAVHPVRLESRVNAVLDDSAADKGKKRKQDKWFGYWNKVKDGRVMASMGDIYLGFKEINRMHEEGTEQEKTKAGTLLTGLRDDFDWHGKSNWLVSSTRISYSPNSEDSTIVQHYRCSQPGLSKETYLTIPVYRGVPIADVADDSHGLNYLQTLFDTVDDTETIIQTLEFVSGKNRGDIKVWTSPLNSTEYYTRSERPERAAGFYCYDGDFRVRGGSLSDGGRSRGVLVK